MKNIHFPDEEITVNDLYFVCYMIERVARRLHQRNYYVVNALTKDQWQVMLSDAPALHCENPLKIEDTWIQEYTLESGEFDIEAVDRTLAERIPTATQMGKVYMRLIVDTLQPGEDYADAIIRVYNDPICEVIDNYATSAYYEPSYVIARAYNDGGF